MLLVDSLRLAKFQRPFQVGVDLFSIGLVRVQFHAKGAETALFQPNVDHVEGSTLFSDEEHPLPLFRNSSNNVGNRLRLSGAWRPLDNQICTRSRRGNDLSL